MKKTRGIAIVAGFVVSVGAAAADSIAVTSSASCVSPDQNLRVAAKLPAGVSSARVYFHADGQAGDYYLDMQSGSGEAWSVLPRVAAGTTRVVFQVRATDAAGRPVTSAETRVPVRNVCSATSGSLEQSAASRLVVGQTVDGQSSVPPGFAGDGIASVISADGVLQSRQAADLAATTAATTARSTPGLTGAPTRQPKPVSSSRP